MKSIRPKLRAALFVLLAGLYSYGCDEGKSVEHYEKKADKILREVAEEHLGNKPKKLNSIDPIGMFVLTVGFLLVAIKIANRRGRTALAVIESREHMFLLETHLDMPAETTK